MTTNRLRIDPGNHNCSEMPDPGEEACSILLRNDGEVEWNCPECHSQWYGKPDFGKYRKQQKSRYFIRWHRLYDSSGKWKRREIKRLEALMRGTDD